MKIRCLVIDGDRCSAYLCGLIAAAALIFFLEQHVTAEPWNPDLGNGRYKNPIVFTDFSDPDVIRVGDDFYLTASSFNYAPGLPILHSRDLIHWRIINYALPQLYDTAFDWPQHSNGVWAPSIRFHNGQFYIYWGDPDRGIYMVHAKDPAGAWSEPVLVKKTIGNIDPCPLWDDDGKAYLVHAFAYSRIGVQSLLQVAQMSPDGTKVIDKGTIVFDGHKNHPTIEGPKFYKHNGYYYIFAPAGGVPTGWQVVMRSKHVVGPYEDRIVLAQGKTAVNGPHQGGYVELANGECWFIHFQDHGPYGRILYLEPMKWVDDWPVIGDDADGDGTGQPVLEAVAPKVDSAVPVESLQTGDEFNGESLSLAWQWPANPNDDWYSLTERAGWLRLKRVALSEGGSLWQAPNLLLQKFPAPAFTATTKMDCSKLGKTQRAGLIVFGLDYAALSVYRDGGEKTQLELGACTGADRNNPEKLIKQLDFDGNVVWLRVEVTEPALCQFSYSLDGKSFTPIGEKLKSRPCKWMGAKIGLFCTAAAESSASGHADFEFFRIE